MMISYVQVLFSGLCHHGHLHPKCPQGPHADITPYLGRGLRKTRVSIYQGTDFPVTLTHLSMTVKVRLTSARGRLRPQRYRTQI